MISDEWKILTLCRALTFATNDIILLERSLDGFSEDYQQKIIEFLKSIIRKDQIILISSKHLTAMSYVDEVVTLENNDSQDHYNQATDNE